MPESDKPLVLVTGGAGFLGIWVIVSLLRQGYRVRSTVRSLARRDEITSKLLHANISSDQISSSLSIVQTDLLHDEGWADAMKGVTYVQHVASPFPNSLPKHEDELILPAREGTLRVLRFARDAGSVSRVVVTSSVAAVSYGYHAARAAGTEPNPFTEENWSDISSKDASAYPKSKTQAERAAWDFIKNEGGKLELAVVNPVTILGPTLGTDATSLHIVSELLDGNAPGIPRINVPIVDVRDCADLHLLAMRHADAKGSRFICIGEGGLMMEEVAKILKKNLGSKARKVPSIMLPDFVVKLVAIFLPIAKLVVPDLGVRQTLSNAKAREVLGWQWKYGSEQAVLAAAESLVEFGIVKV